jgi:diguanylate cyclase
VSFGLCWSEGVATNFTTWVNVSAKQLIAGEICSVVQAALQVTELPPSRLGVELTETSLVTNEASIEYARRQLDQLHRMGVRIAIDDFGTGFSSLSHLQRFPVDASKVDRSFVSGVALPGKDAAIVSSVISLAHALGLTVIAEGVETEEQLHHLRKLGCDLGQGYLFARPGPPRTMATLLASPVIARQRAIPDAERIELSAPRAPG